MNIQSLLYEAQLSIQPQQRHPGVVYSSCQEKENGHPVSAAMQDLGSQQHLGVALPIKFPFEEKGNSGSWRQEVLMLGHALR